MLALLTSSEFCMARRAKSSGRSVSCCSKLLGLLARADDDQPGLDRLTILGFVRFLSCASLTTSWSAAHLRRASVGHTISRLYCLLVDAALFFEHLEPLFAADFEALGHAVDLGVDFLSVTVTLRLRQ